MTTSPRIAPPLSQGGGATKNPAYAIVRMAGPP